ncbi:FAD-dependent oxidoreductase [Corynebacterium auriscanis]|uniref:Oxidoreductase n=1 Tax=Corynebacterium auriscanis TaxID=99807 RepID=A0A0A2DLV1_9CORY|nr:FAD-dependent oxidoreductase [Corynebacterium auriscanis]KGM18757.1 oxidoreductase [Corynebacterium auriscanis]WJY73097.1 protoporphyrinogen oxidase [Corynebacterium auriscanis]
MGEIAVIGGGIAGLAAARTLRNAGKRCVVIESRDMLGGHVRSERIDDMTIDHGFQLFNSWYPALKEILRPGEYAALGIRTFQPGIQTLTDQGHALIMDPVRAPALIPAFLRSSFDSAFSLRDLWGLQRWISKEMPHRSSLELRSLRKSDKVRDMEVAESLDKSGVKRALRKVALDPLVEAFLYDKEGASSATFAKWLLMSLMRGNLAVPDNGMGEISATMARIPGCRFEMNSPIESIEIDERGAGGVKLHIRNALTGELRVEEYERVVLAVRPKDENALVGTPMPKIVGISSWWFVSDEPIAQRPLFTVDGTGKSPIAGAAELTAAAPSYAPDRHLVACNVVHSSEPLPSDRRIQQDLGVLFGVDSSKWELVKRQDQPNAKPIIAPTHAIKDSQVRQDIQQRIFLAGTHHATPTLDGAVRSGQLAAKNLLDCIEA